VPCNTSLWVGNFFPFFFFSSFFFPLSMPIEISGVRIAAMIAGRFSLLISLLPFPSLFSSSPLSFLFSFRKKENQEEGGGGGEMQFSSSKSCFCVCLMPSSLPPPFSFLLFSSRDLRKSKRIPLRRGLVSRELPSRCFPSFVS